MKQQAGWYDLTLSKRFRESSLLDLSAAYVYTQTQARARFEVQIGNRNSKSRNSSLEWWRANFARTQEDKLRHASSGRRGAPRHLSFFCKHTSNRSLKNSPIVSACRTCAITSPCGHWDRLTYMIAFVLLLRIGSFRALLDTVAATVIKPGQFGSLKGTFFLFTTPWGRVNCGVRLSLQCLVRYHRWFIQHHVRFKIKATGHGISAHAFALSLSLWTHPHFETLVQPERVDHNCNSS